MNWTRINSQRGLGKIPVIETDTATSGGRRKGQMFTLKKGKGGGLYFLNETSACALKPGTRV
jgi:hypothetical protein